MNQVELPNPELDEAARHLAGLGAAADPARRAQLDAVQHRLRSEAMWVEPGADVLERITATLGRSTTVRPRRSGPPWRWIAAAAAAVVVVVGALAFTREERDDAVEFALAPTDLLPEAAGRVRITSEESGLRIELEASGLPRRDNGTFYQAWLRNSRGDLVPIGTFHDGDGVVLWAGVALADYPTLTVTEEAADNNQASSGRRVLAGTAPSS